MIKSNYISCACNQLANAVDWGRNDIVCYAANHAIAVYDSKANKFGKVKTILHEHSDRVNVIRWIQPKFPKLESEFISASTDGKAIIWKAVDLTNLLFKAFNIIKINEPVSLCDAIYINENDSNLLAYTSSVNGDFRLWFREDDEIVQIQVLNFSNKLPIQARLMLLPVNSKDNSKPILLISMEDFKIHIYSPNCTNGHGSVYKKFETFVNVLTIAGHEDWIVGIDYTYIDSENTFLATSSQDKLIRLWRISPCIQNSGNKELKTKKQKFLVYDIEFEICLESVLRGHEAWVYGVHWHPPLEINGKYTQPMKFLSCSLDKTAIIWELREEDCIWSESVRVGEVGGNSLGFYGCKFSPDGKAFLTHSYHGSFHIWEFQEELCNWRPRTAPSGHYGAVVDLAWDPKGRFLVTTSCDQTTRIHAPWPVENEDEESWQEISRPQIHGYNMSCLSILKSFMFASGAEEKIIRIFTAPRPFKNYLEKISNDISDFDTKVMAEYASVPALGLTNKAILDYENIKDEENLNDIKDISLKDFSYNEPPTEEELIRRTLWPELQKLYGHGYEIFSMAARHDGALLATASKSSSMEHAAIIIWNTKSWSHVQKLYAHQLTVTQMEFSPDDNYLLSVSRDRKWALHVLKEGKYELLAISPKKNSLHTRIIWCCSWTKDSKYFATGSRDGKVGLWNKNIESSNKEDIVPVTKLLTNDKSVTAIAFDPTVLTEGSNFYLLAIGYDNGCIEVTKIVDNHNSNNFQWERIAFLNTSEAHHLTVRRLAFSRRQKNKDRNCLQLASCGSDTLVRVYDIQLKE